MRLIAVLLVACAHEPPADSNEPQLVSPAVTTAPRSSERVDSPSYPPMGAATDDPPPDPGPAPPPCVPIAAKAGWSAETPSDEGRNCVDLVVCVRKDQLSADCPTAVERGRWIGGQEGEMCFDCRHRSCMPLWRSAATHQTAKKNVAACCWRTGYRCPPVSDRR